MFLLILANILTVMGFIIDFYVGFKYRDKPTILKFNVFTSTLSLVACLLLGGKAGAINCFVTILRLVTIYFKDKYNKKFYGLFVVFCIAYLLMLSDWSGWYVVFLCISAYCSFIPKWFCKNTQWLRIGGILANIFVIPYAILIKNYADIPVKIINIFSIGISFAKWAIVEKKEKRTLSTVTKE